MDENGKYHACDECDWRKPGEWHTCTGINCTVWHRPPTQEEEAKHFAEIWDKVEWNKEWST